MAPKRRDMAQRRIVRERTEDIVAAGKRAQRQTAADCLSHHDDIRHDAEMLERENRTCATKAGQHFVEDQQCARAIASLAKCADKSDLRNAYAALCLNRLDHHRCDSRIDLLHSACVIERQVQYRTGQRAEWLAHRWI